MLNWISSACIVLAGQAGPLYVNTTISMVSMDNPQSLNWLNCRWILLRGSLLASKWIHLVDSLIELPCMSIIVDLVKLISLAPWHKMTFRKMVFLSWLSSNFGNSFVCWLSLVLNSQAPNCFYIVLVESNCIGCLGNPRPKAIGSNPAVSSQSLLLKFVFSSLVQRL